jgi:predicted nucleic acid-binding protein
VRSGDSARATASAVISSTTVRVVDSGILRYAVSRDREERDKAARANDLLAARDVALSVQVLQESYPQVTRAGRPDPLTHEQAARLVESFLRVPVLDITTDLMLAAAATCQRFGVSYRDAAILEAARSLGCDLVLSEDLGDGQDYAGVRVENPFRRWIRGEVLPGDGP